MNNPDKKEDPENVIWKMTNEQQIPMFCNYWEIWVFSSGEVNLRLGFRENSNMKEIHLIAHIVFTHSSAKIFVKFLAPFLGLITKEENDER